MKYQLLFRNLSDWKIEAGNPPVYGCGVNVKTKTAELSCDKDNKFVIHELIHIALRDLKNDWTRERAEVLVQDLCEIICLKMAGGE